MDFKQLIYPILLFFTYSSIVSQRNLRFSYFEVPLLFDYQKQLIYLVKKQSAPVVHGAVVVDSKLIDLDIKYDPRNVKLSDYQWSK